MDATHKFTLPAAACVFTIAASLFIPDLLFVSPLSFAATYYLMAKALPRRWRKREAARAESALPDALRSIAVQLDVGIPFEKSISGNLNGVANGMEKGAGIEEAIHAWSERYDSIFIKRSAAQLISAYQHGNGAEPLRRLADEQAAVVRARMKEYHGRIVLYSLMFIGLAAIAPALLQAFMILGSSFLDVSFTPEQAFAIPVLVFPLLNGLLLIKMGSERPVE